MTPKISCTVGSIAATLLLGCGGTLVAGGSAEPARLRLSFHPGQVTEYRTELHTAQAFGTRLDVTVPAEEYLEKTSQTRFDVPPDAALDYGGELRYVQRAWLQVERGQMLGSEITGAFVTDVAWIGIPDARQGFDPVHAEGQLEARTERTA